MFDVSHKEIVADSIILYCINDSDELSLIEKFKGFLASQTTNLPAAIQGILQFLTEQFIPAEKNELSFTRTNIDVRRYQQRGIVYMSFKKW